MKTQVECSRCRERFSVPNQWLGRQAKCAKCGHRFQLASQADLLPPAAPTETAPAENLSVDPTPIEAAPMPVDTAPVGTVPVDAVPVGTVPVDTAPVDTAPVDTVPIDTVPVDTVPVDTVPVNPASSATTPAGAVPAPLAPREQRSATGGPAVGGAVVDPVSSAGLPRRRAPRKTPIALWASMLGGGVALAALVFVLVTQDGKPPAVAGGGRSDPNRSDQGAGLSGSSHSIFILRLDGVPLRDVAVEIDQRNHPLGSSRQAEFQLDPGPHQMRIVRRGYEPVEVAMDLAAGDTQNYYPTWRPLPAGLVTPTAGASGGILLQHVELARERARGNGKDVLILFAGSAWSTESRQAATEYRQLANAGRLGAFEPVLLDFPREPSGVDPALLEHYRFMLRHYNVEIPEDFPRMIATDAEGLPLAVSGEWGEPSALAPTIASFAGLRRERDALLSAIRGAAGGERLQAAERALEWLRERDVVEYYGAEVQQWHRWAAEADPRNAAGRLESFFDARFRVAVFEAFRDGSPEAAGLLAELRAWHSGKRFKDADLAAQLLLLAAVMEIRAERIEEAREFVAAAGEYSVRDPELARAIGQLSAVMTQSPDSVSGSGFVVAPGVVVTNAHVVADAVKVVLRQSGSGEDIAARVIARDPQLDLALLEFVSEQAFEPLGFNTKSLGRGESVAAFGYPLGDAIGGGLKLTTGVVSGLPEASTDNMLLLDMRVNPGNSGGPLCNRQGAVAAMVTAKTSADGESLDTYGMAIPAAAVVSFLEKHIAGYRRPAAPPEDGVPPGWDVVDQRVSHSVLMVVAEHS